MRGRKQLLWDLRYTAWESEKTDQRAYFTYSKKQNEKKDALETE